MEALWSQGDMTAKELAALLQREVGWNVNTTYTVIKKCVAKGVIRRSEPHFQCHALVSQDEVRQYEASTLVDKMFDGSPSLLFASLLDGQKVSRDELNRLRQLIEAFQ